MNKYLTVYISYEDLKNGESKINFEEEKKNKQNPKKGEPKNFFRFLQEK